MEKNKIWFTSDLHFGHDKDFIYAARGFSSSQEHDATLVEKWNSLVAPEDDVYVLGDLALGSPENVKKIAELNGKLHIILGNHDTSNRAKAYTNLPNVEEVLGYAHPFKYHKWHFFLSHYPSMVGNFDDTDKTIKRLTWNLCGHSHTTDRFAEYPNTIYHVELDAHGMKPVNIEEIIKDIKGHYVR